MSPFLALAMLPLIIGESHSAIDFQNFKLEAPTVVSREEKNAQNQERMDIWDEALANITAAVEELEALKDTGFPTSQVTNNPTSATTTTTTTTPDSAEAEQTVFTGRAEEFTSRMYAGYFRNYEGDHASGLCASRVHPGVLYYINDGSSGKGWVYAIDIKNHGQIISKITLNVANVDWEDMACGPCSNGNGDHCIYILDAGSSGSGPVNKLYKFKEPEDISADQVVTDVETTSFSSYTSNCETLMVSPSGRIFTMDSVEDSFPFYEIVGGRARYLFSVGLWSYYEGPKSADISPDGTGFIFKMEDRVYYFYVEDETKMKSVLSDSDNRVKFPYLQEWYGTAIAWSNTGGSFYTSSEGTNEPIYEYIRLK
ncbi:uncharacterized protein LOC124130969 [Haliotis rufescens]|uniref:uncharacterized protein LOC124130969 n=1 Tax=Haliotis rufescens TaxID=6454 RepID=UPI001EB0A9C4|nr:uncharacterized protein LOC124130969 [Haliotis rufescens]